MRRVSLHSIHLFALLQPVRTSYFIALRKSARLITTLTQNISDLLNHVEHALHVARHMKYDVVEYRKCFYHLHAQLF
jgi:NAD-dependent SIR2 family protein deacetylase